MYIFVLLGFSLFLNNPFLGEELLGTCTLNSERYHQIALQSGWDHAYFHKSSTHGKIHTLQNMDMVLIIATLTQWFDGNFFAFPQSLPKLSISSTFISHLCFSCELPFISFVHLLCIEFFLNNFSSSL